MKKLFLILLMTVATASYSQSCDSTRLMQEIHTLKNDAWMRLGVGIFSHIIGISQLVGGDLKNPDVLSPFIMYNTVGIGFDIMAFIEFNRARKKKKELKKLYPE